MVPFPDRCNQTKQLPIPVITFSVCLGGEAGVGWGKAGGGGG